MTRDNWTTATAGRSEGYSIAGRAFAAVFTFCGALFLIWAVSNQTVIRFESDTVSRAAP